ncbi:hypothetical protein CDAR_310201 [Caerostris darwini]|uniref:Uncharacterized protein n=1 Tax=Caerostris darwini TaxID=1538125 RepID=A0AAV4WTD5_9ARAC|nr:hypothetical protein CDAR_310201 [Caerostris darwini]
MELPPAANFSMLTLRLHRLFKRYILLGRLRAPPENELKDMVPTFQYGAKTDRRALQSKFKSWAKRMTVFNGDLVLANSKKVILPLEKCEELIIFLHSQEHMSVDRIVSNVSD